MDEDEDDEVPAMPQRATAFTDSPCETDDDAMNESGTEASDGPHSHDHTKINGIGPVAAA